MKIGIIGAGAIGSLFGGLLAENGNDVWLYNRRKEHVQVLKEKGLTIVSAEGRRTIPVKATTKPQDMGILDLAVILVKFPDTEKALEDVAGNLGRDTLVMTLQNGLGNVEKIMKKVERHRVIAGVTSHGSTLLAPGEIYHAGKGPTYLGALEETSVSRVQEVVDLFNRSGIDTKLSDNIIKMLWKKLVANVGINPLTALTGLPNGKLLFYPELADIMRGAVEETVRVAEAKGIDLELEDPFAYVASVCRATAENKSSMLQDVLNRRPTEIDAINGAVVREAEKLSEEVPFNRVLTNLVKVLERRYLEGSCSSSI
ncbi:ketopantoate reductase family protein [Calderihabitans maritimus]|uniref:2-dehydropantoate 2-reductase n=1 Tax=Calderihabitans maritimus TaxID=1246530 RepID=A0A1Z5HRC5_9FIRM|nr:2-dehydropantoate 2-reductase [Calderihabitans maritimus]GAW92083.1 2-dehydropantoate 2-reductase [Calderihabitans maritimus]